MKSIKDSIGLICSSSIILLYILQGIFALIEFDESKLDIVVGSLEFLALIGMYFALWVILVKDYDNSNLNWLLITILILKAVAFLFGFLFMNYLIELPWNISMIVIVILAVLDFCLHFVFFHRIDNISTFEIGPINHVKNYAALYLLKYLVLLGIGALEEFIKSDFEYYFYLNLLIHLIPTIFLALFFYRLKKERNIFTST